MAGLKSPVLSVADTKTHTVVKSIGPFRNVIRPFTVNAAQTRVYVNVNELLGFEIGDLTTGKVLHHVEVEGFEKGAVKRHGCPSHGIGLTPDETELWLCDGHNNAVHVFDNTVMPPKQIDDAHRARSAGVGDVQHRRPARVSVDRRGVRRARPRSWSRR